MKTIKIIVLLLITCTVTKGNAQFLNKLKKKAQEAAERAVERKVEEKTESETEKAFDTIFNNQGKIFKGKKETPAEYYAFTHVYEMDIIQKNDTTKVTYYLSNAEEIMGSAIQMKENEQMVTVMDIPRKTVYNFMEFGDTKSMMSFAMDLEKVVEEQTDTNVHIEATGNTKDIIGYHSEEYKVIGKDFEGTIWVTHEAEISFSEAFAKVKKQKKNMSYNQSWMSMVEGLTLEMNMTDTSKKKPKNMKMQCTGVDTTNYTIYTREYENTF